MEIVIGLVVIGGIVLLILSRRRRPAPGPGSPAAPTFTAPVPTFRVVALGVSGTGKTVLLSTMFHELNYRTHRRSYFLDVDPEDRLRLSAVYEKVSDPTRDWPRATTREETKEYEFTCVGHDDHGTRRPVMRVSYLDFAGGLLEGHEQPGGEALDGLLAAIGRASALLILLDGRRLREVLLDQPAGHAHFARVLRPLTGFAQNASCPIHFVITKWDLVQSLPSMRSLDEPARLRTAVNVLQQYDHLTSLVYEHSGQQVVRVIPVSSVGPDFVRLDDEGRSVKRSDGEINPTNVDIPLSAVVPDLFRQAEAMLDRDTADAVRRTLRGRLRLGAGDFLSGFATLIAQPAAAVTQAALGTLVGPVLAAGAYTLFLDWMEKPQLPGPPLTKRRKEAAAELEAEVTAVRTLRAQVMTDFTRAVYRLEDRYPDSLLSAG